MVVYLLKMQTCRKSVGPNVWAQLLYLRKGEGV